MMNTDGKSHEVTISIDSDSDYVTTIELPPVSFTTLVVQV